MRLKIPTIESFYEESKKLVESFNGFMDSLGKSVAMTPDHFCYKCDSVWSYDNLRGLLEGKNSKFQYQSSISNRRVGLIVLNKPLETMYGNISLLELSDQKPDDSQTEGFHHIEIFTPSVDPKAYQNMINNAKEKGYEPKEVVRDHHTTHDVELDSGFIMRFTKERLLDKVIREEFKYNDQ